jgi:hypothetical protein
MYIYIYIFVLTHNGWSDCSNWTFIIVKMRQVSLFTLVPFVCVFALLPSLSHAYSIIGFGDTQEARK